MTARTGGMYCRGATALIYLIALIHAHAAIVYHSIPDPPTVAFDFPANPRQDIDIDGNGTIDAAILAIGLGTGLSAPRQSAVFGIQDPPPDDIGVDVKALDFGEEIGPALTAFYGPDAGFYRDATEGGGPHLLAGAFFSENGWVVIGDFVLKRAYAGFRFEIDGEPHYAWLDLENAYLAQGAAFKVYGWAYETEPNTPIVAGATPEPTGCALLLLGGGMLLSRRRFSFSK